MSGLVIKSFNLAEILGRVFFAGSTLFIFYGYILKYHKKIFDKTRLVLLLALMFAMVILATRTITSFQMPSFVVPVAGVAMLATMLFGCELAAVFMLCVALTAAIIVPDGLQFLMLNLSGSLFSIYLVSHVKNRSDLNWVAFWVILLLACLGGIVSLFSKGSLFEVLRNLSWGFANGLSSAILAAGLLPIIEAVFHITSDIKLLELANPNQPILKELMIKAPGTYNHSIITGNLAESVAETVDANPILARVGAYYHDIGKLKRPLFFGENLMGGSGNPHDNTNPSLSYLILAAHVKDGVELAKEHALPEEIINIINEHHGTSLVTYFFHRAKERGAKDEVRETSFRYPGEKPKTKEAALIMLADSVEAAARAITKSSAGRLEQMIKKVVQVKLEDGQLDDSSLTFGDLNKIIKIFAQALTSIYHTRIEYPETAVALKRGLVLNGSSDK